jgi:hypothetical protein
MSRQFSTGNDSREGKPFDSVLKFRCSATFLHKLVLEPGMLLGKQNRNIVINKARFLDFVYRILLAHVIEIARHNHILCMPTQNEVLCFKILGKLGLESTIKFL